MSLIEEWSPSVASQLDLNASSRPHPADPAAAPFARVPRIWPAVMLLGLFWPIYSLWRWTELGLSLGFLGFLILLGVGALTTLLFLIWWLAASRISWAERLLVLGTAVFAGIGTPMLAHKLIGPFLLLPGLPLVLTTWTLSVIVARKWPAPRRRRFIAALLCLLCA